MAKTLELSVTNPELIERALESGFGMSELAHIYGISKRTLERRIAIDPELKKARSRGKLQRKVSILKTLYKMVLDENTRAVIFWLTHIDKDEPESVEEIKKLNPALEAIANMSTKELEAELEIFKQEVINEYRIKSRAKSNAESDAQTLPQIDFPST